ncbi:cilia- and flagella-associated protein 119-like [Dysidea avara]|uniref:cilia- and flagella-associated protein 119-like n=1 Tax=Dysidea avara TaxID=196820 RepID=UPI00331943C4
MDGDFKKALVHCLWMDLSFTDVERLMSCQTVLEFRSKLAPFLGVAEYQPTDKRLLIELDLFYYLIQFAKTNGFNYDQISTIFSIVKILHKMTISTPCDNFKETIDHFYTLLLHHSVNRPPYSIGVFTVDQIKLITEYVLSTYFKHFKFYKYVYTKKIQLDITIQYPGVPATPEPKQETEVVEAGPANVDNGTDKNIDSDTVDMSHQTLSVDEEAGMGDKEKELSKIIKSHLNEQLVQLKTSINEQLTAHDQKVSQKLHSMESALGKSKTKKN